MIMKHISIAMVGTARTQEENLMRYMEKSGFRVILPPPDLPLSRTLPSQGVDVVLAQLESEEAETIGTIANACWQIGKPLMVIVTRGTDIDRTSILRLGADDTLTPPFSLEEVVLRVRSLARRGGGGPVAPPRSWILGDDELLLDESKHLCRLNGVPLALTEVQWGILCFLSSHGEMAMTRHQLMEHCLEYDDDVYDRAVDTHIKNLRAKLGNPEWIETVRGYGYRFSLRAREKMAQTA
jgi:DNA-binding response OmpR family regulator